MNIQLLNLIIQPLLGAAAGYITNEYAINMLFNTYTPLKLGGVIPKTRDAFIENVSRLVEEDIINKEKVESILNDKSFIKNFESLVEDFFSKSIYEVTDDISINSVPCIAKSLSDIEQFINKQIEIELPKIINFITEEFNLSDIIDESQINNLSQEIYSYTIKLARDTNILDKFTQNTICKNENTSFMDIVGFDVSSIIAQNISDVFLNSNNIKINHNNNIDLLINKVLQKTNINNLFTEFIEKIVRDNNDKLRDSVSTILNGFIKSTSYKESLFKFSENIINYAKSLDMPLISLFNESCIDNLKSIIVNQTPEVFELIISFVDANKTVIQQIIVDSINETINEQDATKKALLGMAKGSILNSIAKDDISSTVSEYLRDRDNVENLSLLLTIKIKQYLKTTTVSQTMYLLESKEVLTATSLCDFISDYFSNNIPSISDKIIKFTSSSFKNDSFTKSANTKIVDIIKNKIIFSSKSTSFLKSGLSIYLTKIFDMNINELLGDLMTKDNLDLSNNLYGFLEKNQDNIVNNLSLGMSKYIENKKLKDILSNNSLNSIYKFSCEFTDKKLHELKEKVSDENFHKLYNKINNTDNLYKNSSKILKNEVVNNLSPLLRKFVKGLSVSNLSKLDDANLIEMAKSFMGNNLKPIMLFGGMLGAVAGVILALLQPNANVLAPVSILGAFTYSLVGFMTNAIAINMLFKPYKEIKLIRNIPFLKHFSLGYIVKNKENLANSMSSTINNYLLTKDSVSELIENYKYNIKANIFHNISNNDYEATKKICLDNKDKIVNSIYNYSKEAVNLNIDKINNICIDQIEHFKINDFVYGYKGTISKYFISSKEKYNKLILSGLVKMSNSKASVSTILPKSIVSNITQGLDDGFDLVINKVNFEEAKELVLSYDNKYQELLNKNISSVFSVENIVLTDNLVQSVNNKLNSSIKIGNVLNKRINELLNKALYNYFDDINLNSKKLLTLIKPSISKTIQDKVTSNLNFLVKGAYNIMDGNKILDTAVEKALLQKLPVLIESRKDSVYESTSNYLNNKLLNISLKDTGIAINTDIIKNINSDTLKDVFEPLSTCVNEKASTITIKDLIKPLSLDNMQTIFSSYEKELITLIDEVKSLLVLNKDDIMNSSKVLINSYVHDLINKTRINDLFKNMSSDVFDGISNNITNILFEDSLVDMNVNDLLASIKDYEKPLHVFELIDKDKFGTVFEQTMNNLLNDSETKNVLLDIINTVFNRATQNNFKFIDNDAKEYIINIIADAALLSLGKNLSNILEDIEFDKIAKEQINNMKPKKIHMMFNSFAGKYFRTLMLYGFFGAIFGINTIVGLLLSGAYCVKNFIKRGES